MAHLGYFLMLFQGLCSLSSSLPCQFHVVKESMTWTEAQQYCREEFTDLATIDNMAEMEEVKSLMQEAGAKHAWIGLQGKWQWSLADRNFYGEYEAEFRNWAKDQPDEFSSGNEPNCVVQFGQQGGPGRWFYYDCNTTLPFICYDGRNSTHPYVLVNEGKKWADAQRYCREHHTDLASVRNQTENDQIHEVRHGQTTWIGLFRTWEWSDGSSSSFCHWNRDENHIQPDNTGVACTEINQFGLWYDAGCDIPINFICYEEVKMQIVRVQLQVDSQVNISDPALHQGLLQQIQQRLSKAGMPADVRLAWMKQLDGKVFHEKKKEEGRKRRKRNKF